jgi:Zn-dependent protease with chaperone function
MVGPLRVEPWPTELPLRILVTLFAVGIWLLLAITIFGFLYAALIGVFLFFVHLAFITHLRGSAVRLGPQQFPELYARVTALAQRAGLSRMPEVYLLESGGSLNALATRFFRSRMVVLFTDLLEACGDDQAARDMVIGHELGHLKAGHLDWHLLLLPGSFIPFLGAAYSRAREHTCDRWGAALCGDPAGAVRGLAILAAGGKFGPQVNLTAYVAQQWNRATPPGSPPRSTDRCWRWGSCSASSSPPSPGSESVPRCSSRCCRANCRRPPASPPPAWE